MDYEKLMAKFLADADNNDENDSIDINTSDRDIFDKRAQFTDPSPKKKKRSTSGPRSRSSSQYSQSSKEILSIDMEEDLYDNAEVEDKEMKKLFADLDKGEVERGKILDKKKLKEKGKSGKIENNNFKKVEKEIILPDVKSDELKISFNDIHKKSDKKHFIVVGKDMKFSKIKLLMENKSGGKVKSISFDGDCINDSATPNSLELEDEDFLDVKFN